MKTKTRLVLPILLSLLLLGSLAWGGWCLYDSRVDRSGWVERKGRLIYRDFHAKPVSGWLELPEGQYFLDQDGAPLLSWQAIGIHTYYFFPDGRMATGWQDLDGQTRYFGEDGVLATGWLTLDGRTHHFASDGSLDTGWLELEGQKFYLPEGSLATGWQDIDGSRYYFHDNGILATGLISLEDGQYYLGEDGVMVTGTVWLEDGQYRFLEDGRMFTGWEDTEEGRRYFPQDGPMVIGWTELEESQYYFDDTGILQTGWLEEGEYRYYLTPEGPAAVGPHKIDGQTHYFTPKGIEVVLVNARHWVPGDYTLDLVDFPGGKPVDRRCFDALTRMLSDCVAAGNEYVFNSGYRSMNEQTLILESRTQLYMEQLELSFEEAEEKALETVAVPGTSEHHLGLAVDLLGDGAIAWLEEHCWDYGFIRRYYSDQKNWTGIADEPWHFRYVGREVSLDMRDSGLSLEEYLGAEPVK